MSRLTTARKYIQSDNSESKRNQDAEHLLENWLPSLQSKHILPDVASKLKTNNMDTADDIKIQAFDLIISKLTSELASPTTHTSQKKHYSLYKVENKQLLVSGYLQQLKQNYDAPYDIVNLVFRYYNNSFIWNYQPAHSETNKNTIASGPEYQLFPEFVVGLMLRENIINTERLQYHHNQFLIDCVKLPDHILNVELIVSIYIKSVDYLAQKMVRFDHESGIYDILGSIHYKDLLENDIKIECSVDMLGIEYKSPLLDPWIPSTKTPSFEDTKIVWNIEQKLLHKFKTVSIPNQSYRYPFGNVFNDCIAISCYPCMSWNGQSAVALSFHCTKLPHFDIESMKLNLNVEAFIDNDKMATDPSFSRGLNACHKWEINKWKIRHNTSSLTCNLFDSRLLKICHGLSFAVNIKVDNVQNQIRIGQRMPRYITKFNKDDDMIEEMEKFVQFLFLENDDISILSIFDHAINEYKHGDKRMFILRLIHTTYFIKGNRIIEQLSTKISDLLDLGIICHADLDDAFVEYFSNDKYFQQANLYEIAFIVQDMAKLLAILIFKNEMNFIDILHWIDNDRMLRYVNSDTIITKAMDFLGHFINILATKYSINEIEILLLKYRFNIENFINDKDIANSNKIMSEWTEQYHLPKTCFLFIDIN